MNHFPVTASVLSADYLVYFIQERYMISAQSACRLLKTFVNDTYMITDGVNKYIFRVYTLRWRSKKEIEEELRLIHLLRENKLGVSYPLADETGNYIQELAAPEGTRFGVLFSFAPGGKMYNPPAEIHEQLGGFMAKIHQLTSHLKLERVSYTPQVLLVDAFEKYRSYIPPGSDEMAFMLSTQQYLLQELKQVNMDEIRKGAVHLDIWADNLHLDAFNNITLFDFDFCGNGWLCYDIAFYLLLLHQMEPEGEYKKKAAAFLNGYESVTKISEEEKRLIPAIGTSLHFFYLGVQRERFATVFFNEEHVKRNINFRIKKWFEFDHTWSLL